MSSTSEKAQQYPLRNLAGAGTNQLSTVQERVRTTVVFENRERCFHLKVEDTDQKPLQACLNAKSHPLPASSAQRQGSRNFLDAQLGRKVLEVSLNRKQQLGLQTYIVIFLHTAGT
jgi:hypothetical protein